MTQVVAELAGTVAVVHVVPGDRVPAGRVLLAVEAMKMEHPSRAPHDAVVTQVLVAAGDRVERGQRLLVLEGAQVRAAAPEAVADRPELRELHQRRALLQDAARPEAVRRRHAAGRPTAREALAALIDEGSFIEYGGLAVAAQHRTRSEQELRERTPGDGFLAGLATVAGRSCAVATYDYTVLAGTQGLVGHAKKDRLFDVVARLRLPVVLLAEGGGGRPNDTDVAQVTGLTTDAFRLFAGLSGLVPRIGVAAGFCFAGNAGLLGLCDVVVATESANIGMGGPAMVEGGGLGRVAPQEIGPAPLLADRGVVDVLVPDDAAALDVARRLLLLLSGPTEPGRAPDPAPLRDAVPADRRAPYDPGPVVDALLDVGTPVELRARFGASVRTWLGRLGGRTVGVVASDSRVLSGALDSDACDKAARFLQLCEAFDLPVVSLLDTPGIMVGPQAEATALVRHAARVFAAGARLSVPLVAVVCRRAYGLGAQALAGGSLHAPLLTLAWPTGELGPMGVEGAVRLGLRAELEVAPDPEALVRQTVARVLERGRAVSVASYFEVDDVIDPVQTRDRVLAVLAAAPPRTDGVRRWVDTW